MARRYLEQVKQTTMDAGSAPKKKMALKKTATPIQATPKMKKTATPKMTSPSAQKSASTQAQANKSAQAKYEAQYNAMKNAAAQERTKKSGGSTMQKLPYKPSTSGGGTMQKLPYKPGTATTKTTLPHKTGSAASAKKKYY